MRMDLSISVLAIIAASVVGMIIAFVWYSDWGVAGTVWRRLTGVTKEDSARAGAAPFVMLTVCIVATAVALAVALSVATSFFGTDSIWLALGVALAAWLGLSLSTLAQHNAFEQKPGRLTVVNGAYQLVLFVAMALTIGVIQ